MVIDSSPIEQLSQSNPTGSGQGNVTALLRRVAALIDKLGAVEVQDITFHDEMDDDGNSWPHMTVYFHESET